jgi:hypothetical protein
MNRRFAVFVFGAVPATCLALILSVGTVGEVSSWLRFGYSLSIPSLLLELACLCGTVALWMIALRTGALIQGRRDALVIGIMLLSGVAAAALPLIVLPSLWRCAALSPILTAFAVLPSVWRALGPRN